MEVVVTMVVLSLSPPSQKCKFLSYAPTALICHIEVDGIEIGSASIVDRVKSNIECVNHYFHSSSRFSSAVARESDLISRLRLTGTLLFLAWTCINALYTQQLMIAPQN